MFHPVWFCVFYKWDLKILFGLCLQTWHHGPGVGSKGLNKNLAFPSPAWVWLISWVRMPVCMSVNLGKGWLIESGWEGCSSWLCTVKWLSPQYDFVPRSEAKEHTGGTGVKSWERQMSRSQPLWVEDKREEGSGEMSQQQYTNWLWF